MLRLVVEPLNLLILGSFKMLAVFGVVEAVGALLRSFYFLGAEALPQSFYFLAMGASLRSFYYLVIEVLQRSS